MKLKVLGMGLLALMATAAFAVMNASATGGGHFVSDTTHTTIVGTESGTHRLHLISIGSEGEIGCEKASYHGTAVNETEPSISITPTYENCYTTPEGTKFPVTPNGCTYVFTVAAGTTNQTEQTVHLSCPEGKAIEIHHPNCTITVAGPQTVENAVTYTTVTENGKHALTLHVHARFKSQYHGGICVFLGTNHEGELKGSVTVKGTNTSGEQVNITAT